MTSSSAVADAFARVRLAGFTGRATKLSDLDLPRIGHTIGVGEDEIHAVIEVEASGGGFDALGRPKMLFEPHVFYRNLTGSARAQAVQAGLAYASWKPGSYPKDSYPRLKSAMAISETAALKAASWGLGQILGENYVAAGYESPQQMVLAFVEGGESEHLAAMMRFIVDKRLDDELRAHNWAGFARGYNGSAYAQHGYHTKLAAAYAKWRKIKDTPWSPDQDAVGKPVPVPPVTIDFIPPPSAGPAFAPAARNPSSPPALAPAPPQTVAPAPRQSFGAWLSSLLSRPWFG
ncbi:N-acetylmuramidase family protein [Methylobacterium sp. Leaf118]|uniref:N-acetylmuramidase family protein n=1 Tax=Methylobacterium sp. Leaf118 TaxID=2876562 RepID=UPI001E564557|nr:N-acetylmuramidase family protein [Methylobacterium sp. Leaf118]